MTDHQLRIRTWIKGSEDDRREGLMGYLSLRYGRLVLGGIVLRRTADGRYALSFPTRTDRVGRRHSYVCPVDDDTRRAIEREVFGQLRQREQVGIETEDQP